MKKLILFAGIYCLQPTLHAASYNPKAEKHAAPLTASERAMAHFRSYYADAPDAEWFNLNSKDMYCVFHEGVKTERVYYNGAGYWQFTLISYLPSDLEKNVAEQVLHFFEGYHISYVNEIQSVYDAPAYVINIENADHIKVIKFVHGEIEVQQDLQKG